MKRYHFPKGMRVSTLKERGEFYTKEFIFPSGWFKKSNIKKPVIAIDLGTDSGIFKKGVSSKKKQLLYSSEYSSYNEVKDKLRNYLPEDVYYSRNLFKDRESFKQFISKKKDPFKIKTFLGQELVFDLDPDNIVCTKCREYKDIYSFCIHCFTRIKKEAILLHNFLQKRFKNVKIVYSGRGFHLHVLDHKAFRMKHKERKRLSKMVLRKKFHIDPWVTNGYIDLVRLPNSLHGLVSRVVKEISPSNLKTFDPFKDKKVIPRFLTNL